MKVNSAHPFPLALICHWKGEPSTILADCTQKEEEKGTCQFDVLFFFFFTISSWASHIPIFLAGWSRGKEADLTERGAAKFRCRNTSQFNNLPFQRSDVTVQTV